MNRTLYIFARFHAKPGSEERLRDALIAILEPTRAESGCRDVGLYQSSRDPAVLFIHSQWASEKDFELHAELPHMRILFAAAPALIDREIDVTRTWRIES